MSEGQIFNVDTSGIGCFDGFLSQEMTDFLIQYYDKAKSIGFGEIWHHPGKDNGIADDSRATIWPPPYKDGTWENDEEGILSTSPLVLDEFMKVFMGEIYPKYAEKMHGLKAYKWTIQDAKIQKTIPGGGYHAWHTECSAIDVMNRIFVVQVYLNDVEEGGETEFLSQHKRVSAKRGRVVLFPGTYTHMHRGNPPISGDKYVMNMWGIYSQK